MLSQMKLLREPLLHFAALGAALFALSALARRGGAADGRAATAGPVQRTVTIAAADVDAARATFRAASKREPSGQELADLVQGVISEELLFREGLALELDRDDRVVRRRVIEKMTALARPTPPDSDPPRDELARHYQSYRHRFTMPAAVSFEQLYFDPKQRGDGDGAPAAAARALAALGGARAGDGPPAGVGDPFVLPVVMKRRSQLELAHLMGEGFAAAVFAAPAGRWHGPVTSKHGVHLVRVVEREPERMPPFEEVEKQVRADWLTQETRGLRAAALTLLPRYRISLPQDLRRTLEGAPALAPFLERAR
jgi:peptidyl-prolyl cis-trans isomerase C